MAKVKFNLKNVHIAPIKEDGSFDEIFAHKGAVSLSLDAQGDIEKFYADGIVYYQSAPNNGYEGSIEFAMITDEMREKIFKEVIDTKKVMAEKTGVEFAPFALGFQVDGDAKETLFWFVNCAASRPGVAAQTNEDTKQPQTETLNLSCTCDDDGFVRYKTTEETDSATRANWFKSVYKLSSV